MGGGAGGGGGIGTYDTGMIINKTQKPTLKQRFNSFFTKEPLNEQKRFYFVRGAWPMREKIELKGGTEEERNKEVTNIIMGKHVSPLI